MGMSRSATVVCAYLVATARMTPHEALAAVKAKRPIVNPNVGFLAQLDEYDRQLLGGRSEARRLRPRPTKRIEIEGNVS